MKKALKEKLSFFFNTNKWKSGNEGRFQNYIALGDSIVSDDYPGKDKGAASLLHRNKEEMFPDFADLKKENPNIQFHNLTKTGWMLPDLLERAQALESDTDPTLIMICAGGNDLLHAHAEMLSIDEALDKVAKNLVKLQEMMKGKYPNALFRILNTYDPTDGTGLFQSGRHVPEAPEALSSLNSVIRDFAQSDLVDIHKHFLGHGIRHADPAYHHYDTEDPSGWFKMDIEPNNRGASEVRRKVWESLQ